MWPQSICILTKIAKEMIASSDGALIFTSLLMRIVPLKTSHVRPQTRVAATGSKLPMTWPTPTCSLLSMLDPAV